MDYETIKLDRDGALLTVRLSRPEKRNAINRQMHADLQDLCHRLRDDTDTRVVIFAGEGDIFSAGADTSEWGDPGSPNELEVRHVSGVGSRTSGDIENLGQVTIAAVRGCAIGGGLVFAACCDLRVAGEGTWFLDPGGRAGPALGWNALPRLAREMGHSRALELTITCERFDAKRAYEYGLVTHLEPDDAVKAKARAGGRDHRQPGAAGRLDEGDNEGAQAGIRDGRRRLQRPGHAALHAIDVTAQGPA